MACKVSIIVPVYNSSAYLRSCIGSIINQSLSALELILIDDGSTDDSGTICDEYAQMDPRITVIHKENAGVSAARNTGLAAAMGEYVGFVDSDDTIQPVMYQEMYEAAIENQAEIVMCDAVTVFSDGRREPDTITQLPQSCVVEHANWTPDLLKEMAGSAWRCIYRRDLIDENRVLFPTSLKFSEDRIFNLYLMGYASRLFYLKKGFYNRLIWEGSAVHRFHNDYYVHIKKAARATKQAIETVWSCEDKNYEKIYLKQFIGGAVAAINNYCYSTSKMTWKQQWNMIDAICKDDDLQKAISVSKLDGLRENWISKRCVTRLLLSAKLANLKHHR